MQETPQAKNILFGVLILVLVAVGSFALGQRSTGDGSTVLGSALFASSNAVQPIGVDFSPLWKAWSTLESKYVPSGTSTAITDEERVWGLIQGLAASYEDPYTVFLPPADNEIFEDDISGEFSGVGMEIGIRNSVLTVIAPLKGTPAERAGILAGDIILRIDGAPTDDLSIDEAVKLIRGEKGTEVVLTMAREGEGEFVEISVIRDVIEIPTINTRTTKEGIFVIELYNFSAMSSNLFQSALREFAETGGDKLILDLRGNPGGFLESSVDMASFFLPAGEVVLQEDFGGEDNVQMHRSKGYDVFDDDLKMAILINRGSASASEILAGALHQHGVAVLIGEQSFGKGSVQELVDITDETSLKVTIARWLTPDGTSISEGGLVPDYEVERTIEDLESGNDPQLDKAIQVLLGM